MAQIIKHRRGSIDSVAATSAKKGELIMATGSIGNMNGPWIFIGHTDGVNGGYNSVSKIYQGASAPTITVGSYGSTIDGTPFYASGNKTLYILSKDGNTAIDLTGNIEGNTISGVTINSLTGTSANITSVTGSNGNFTYLTGSTFTSTNSDITSLTGSNAKISNVTGGTLTVTGNTVMTGTLFVNDDTSINGDLFITGNTSQTGSIDITGDITLGGNITIGNQTTDIINFGGEVSSSILPIVHDAFDLGSADKNWRDLHVSGTAYINILEAQSISLDGITVFDDLAVSGNTFLGQGGGDILVVSGSIYNDNLTNNRVVIAGTNGLLEDDANFTFDGTTLQVGAGWFNVDTDGDIRTSGSLLVTSTSEFKDAVGMDSTLDVTGSATLKSTLEVKGATGLNSTLDVTGSATLKSTLQVDSTTQLKGAVGINSTLDVTGSVNLNGDLTVTGTTTLNGSTYVTGLTDNRIVIVGVGGLLEDDANFTFDGTTFKVGNGEFEVDVVDGDIRTSGSLTVDGGITNNGDLTVNGILTVTGDTQLLSNLYVSGNLEILGSSTNVNIQSTTVEIGDNIILVNAYSPFQRYAGITGYDSGSIGNSGSMLWDSLNDYWLLQNADDTTSKVIGTTSGSMGSEVSLTDTYFPIATGANTIGNSLLRYSGTTLSFNTNKFTIDSGTGDTEISGNLTLSYSGGTDAGSVTSVVMFKNSSNVVGYVSTADTQNVTTQLLGYDASTGVLEFSSVIDGGTY